MKRIVAMLAAGVVLAGCATRYQEMGATGGVTAAQMTDDLWRISARGNLYTDVTMIQDYVLLKAAETTVAAGRTHFAVVGKHDEGRAPGLYAVSALGGGNEQKGFALLNRGPRDPGEDLMIRLLPRQASAEDKADALDAAQLIANIGRRVKRPE